MLGQALGLTDAEFEALQADDYRESPLFNEREKAALWWAEAFTLNYACRLCAEDASQAAAGGKP